MFPTLSPGDATILDRLLHTAPGLEIWWDSSPLVYSSWTRALLSLCPPDRQDWLARQLRRFYDVENPAATLFTGVTTNPPLSYQAIQDDPGRWREWLRAFALDHPGGDARQAAWALYKEIVRLGARAYLPLFQRTDYRYGHLSAQVNPYTFFDEEQIVSQALELAALEPNIAIKIPGTAAGVRAIRRLTALGVPTNCTSGYCVPQFVAVADAVQAGLLEARRNRVDLTGWRSVVTYMSVRWESEAAFIESARQAGVNLSEHDIRWAGVAIFKNAYRIFRRRAYPSKLLICSLRLGPQLDGVMHCRHIEETAGGQVIFTLPPPFLTELFIETPDLPLAPHIRQEIPVEVMARLQNVPYFTAAYEPDGLTPEQFDCLPALLSTMKQFQGAMDKIVAFAAEAL
ncbi:MAG: transaldolase family protein [Chloroflexota bacterium]